MKKINNGIPEIFKLILSRFINNRDRRYIIGDIEELYCGIVTTKGKVTAFSWVLLQIIKSIPSFILTNLTWGGIMLKSYIKIALRSIKKQKTFSFINLSGLALGLAASFLILLWVEDELNFDRFHENNDSLYRVESTEQYSDNEYRSIASPVPLKEAAVEIPEIKFAGRCTRFGGVQIRKEDITFTEQNIRAIDTEFFEMFSFNILKGNPSTILNDKYSILLTPKSSKKYFGNEDPIGKTILIENNFEMTVTGIVEPAPRASTIQFDFLVNFQFVLEDLERMPRGWGNAISTFVQLNDQTEISLVAEKIGALVKKNNEKSTSVYRLVNIKDIHLHTVFGNTQSVGDIKYIYIFSSIAVFVLIVASINFMNLSTARSASRAREVGMRKVAGALKSNLKLQFLGESFVMVAIAFILAFMIVAAMLPVFNEVTGKEILFSELFRIKFLIGIVLVAIVTAIIAGSYPALYLSKFQPLKILKEDYSANSKNSWFRRGLVVLQFSLSIFLIVGSLVIYSQQKFIGGKSLGFNKNQLLTLRIPDSAKPKFDVLKNELAAVAGVESISATGRHPVFFADYARGVNWPGKQEDQNIRLIFNAADYNFTETMQMEIAKGRSFQKEFSADSSGILLNESAVNMLSLDEPLGAEISLFNGYVTGTVVGVIKDFHHQSLVNKIEPLALLMRPNIYWLSNFVVRFNPVEVEQTLENLEVAWKRVAPNTPFEYTFLDEVFERVYGEQTRLGNIFNLFTGLAIFIACLGLFGLVAYTAEQRTKEIGIRKVLGASTASIVNLLSKEMFAMVIISNLIAWPTAYYLMNQWLQEFAYKIDFNFWFFIISGATVFGIAFTTVFIQAFKAAVKNPSISLRYE